MDFRLTDDQQQLREALRTFCDEVVAPGAARRDEEAHFEQDLYGRLAEMGLFGVYVPAEYGGAGLDLVSYVMAVEELSRACASTGILVSAHTSLCVDPILNFGTEAQKRKYLPALASGEKVGCFSLTEPGSGSDAGAARCTAVETPDGWRINGTKCFVTNGLEAGIVILFAVTDGLSADEIGSSTARALARGSGDGARRGQAGDGHRTTGDDERTAGQRTADTPRNLSSDRRKLSAFIVEAGTPGFKLGKKEKKLGIRASSTMEFIFEDCLIPRENLLGERAKGLRVALTTLDGGRLGVAAQAVGIAQACLEAATGYAKTRHQFNQPIANFQAIQWKLADMAADIAAARLLTYRAAWLKQSRKAYATESAMAKLFASEAATRAANAAVQVFGGYGYISDYPVERFYRDAKITELYEGTSEIQRLVIARQLATEPAWVARG